MISNHRSSTVFLSFAALLLAQMTVSAQSSDNGGSANQPQAQGSTLQPAHITPEQKPPRKEPAIIEDGGWSFEPEYWLNRAQPILIGGATLGGYGTLDYFGTAHPALDGEISMPAGKQSTLRLSYFRVQGDTNETATQDVTLYGEAYNTGDFLTANYTLQVAKLSWDYLSYTWYKPKTKIRMKTLWEVQFANIDTNTSAPLKPITTDVNGNTDYNTSSGSQMIIYPTFGVEFEQPVTRHFRWWANASGFGVPHHGNIWDAEAAIAVRFGQFELIGGEKAYHFKTSPQGSQYFIDTLSGPYVGLRWYWGRGSM